MLDPAPAGGGGFEDAQSVISDVSASSSASSCEENRIKVVCRVRPPVPRETQGRATLASSNRCVEVGPDRRTVNLNSKPQGKSFTFDYAAGEDSTQEELFAEVGQPVTEACLEGYNGTIFCYGQTGSGKTFTTFGPGAVMENHLKPTDPKSYELRGLVPRVLEYLYASIGRQVEQSNGKVSYSCRCSFYEIFNEKVFDLVDETNRDNPTGLTVREDTRKGVYVEGLMEEQVDGAESACEILHRGFRNRHVGETAMNRESSRSHAVFTLVIKATEVVEEEGLTRSRVARFNLVDLAGSERQKDTQASGERLKEASNINKSLSTLGQVINALVEKSAGRFRHIHYRDSKLTFLLRDSLGGNSKTMLVAALSPADQNFGETLSTLKFAQRAKMIKNQAVKNEDTSGSYDALRREVTTLRQKLLAAQQGDGSDGVGVGDGGSMAAGVAAAGSGGEGDGGGGSTAEALLADALKRARAAEEAQRGSRRRVESLLAAAERSEKDSLQLKMVIKFRDGTIAAQRKKDRDQERRVLAEENAHLRKQLEGGVHESSEVSKWRLQFKEAEARLAELTGNATGDVKRLLWGIGDEERFRGELDEKVLDLMDKNRKLTEEVELFEERLHDQTRRAEKRRMSAANRAELEAKKIVENALLSKLQEAQAEVEQTRGLLTSSKERVSVLQTDNSQLESTVLALKKQLDEANRRGAEAVQDRDSRLSDLQLKMEELSREKVRAVEDNGSEVARLEMRMATAIKDNGELLRRTRALEDEADSLDHDLERLEEEKKSAEEAAEATKVVMAEAIRGLEQRMQQQEEAHERESEEYQAEKRSLMKDVEAATNRLKSAKQKHAEEMQERQRYSNDLQERVVDTRAQKQEVEERLKQLQDDHDTLSQQAEFSADRAEELESDLTAAAEDLRRAIAAGVARACAAQHSYLRAVARADALEDALEDTERRLEGATFFRMVQEILARDAVEACAFHKETISCLSEELETTRVYSDAISGLLGAHEVSGGGQVTAAESKDVGVSAIEHDEDVRRRLEVAAIGFMNEEGRRVAADAKMMSAMVNGYERDAEDATRRQEEAEVVASRTVAEVERTAAEFARGEARLQEIVGDLEERIGDMEASKVDLTSDLMTARAQLETSKADLAEAGAQQKVQTQAFTDLETVTSGMRESLAAAEEREVEFEASIARVEESAAAANSRSQELEGELDKLRETCFEFQAQSVLAERRADGLTGEAARLSGEVDRLMEELSSGLVELNEVRKDAKEKMAMLESAVAVRESEKEALADEIARLAGEFREAQESAVARASELEIDVLAKTSDIARLASELRGSEESAAERVRELESAVVAKAGELVARERDLDAARSATEEARVQTAKGEEEVAALEKEAVVLKEKLASTGEELAAAVRKVDDGRIALEEAEARAEEVERAAALGAERSANDLAVLEEELAMARQDLAAAVRKIDDGQSALEEAEAQASKARKGTEEAALAASLDAERNAGELAALQGELASVGKELDVAVRSVEARQSALEEAEARAEEAARAAALEADSSARELTALKEELAAAVRKVETGQSALEEAEIKAEKVTRAAAMDAERDAMELAALEKELSSMGKELATAARNVEVGQSALKEAEAKAEEAALAAAMDAERNAGELAALQGELASVGKELDVAVRSVEARQSALEEAEAEAEEAARAAALEEERGVKELAALKEELAASEKRRGAEEAKAETAEARASELDSLKAEAEKADRDVRDQLQSSELKAAKLQEEVQAVATQMSAAEDGRRELACQVSDLKCEAERLKGELLSKEERACLKAEVETAMNKADELAGRNADLVEYMATMKQRTGANNARLRELQDLNVKLVGHKNNRQKIHQVQKLKEENNDLTRKVKELDDRLFAIKRSGCGPGCAKNSTNSSAAVTTATTTTTTTSTTTTTPSLSPKLSSTSSSDSSPTDASHGSNARSRTGTTSSGEVGGKTYNLRRRAKVAEDGVGGGVGSRVSTRRTGLRDMTNG